MPGSQAFLATSSPSVKTTVTSSASRRRAKSSTGHTTDRLTRSGRAWRHGSRMSGLVADRQQHTQSWPVPSGTSTESALCRTAAAWAGAGAQYRRPVAIRGQLRQQCPCHLAYLRRMIVDGVISSSSRVGSAARLVSDAGSPPKLWLIADSGLLPGTGRRIRSWSESTASPQSTSTDGSPAAVALSRQQTQQLALCICGRIRVVEGQGFDSLG